MGEPIPLALVRAVLKSDSVIALQRGTETHGPALKLICSTAPFNDDLEFHRGLIRACLPADYGGNTLDEIKDMLSWALENAKSHSVPEYSAGEAGPIPLGFAGPDFIFRHQQTKEVVTASADKLTKMSGLLELGPKCHWEAQFPRFGRGGAVIGVDLYAAADALIQACRKVGFRETTHIRGLGVWLEGTRIVVNLGGQEIKSEEFVYSAPPRPLRLTQGDIDHDLILEAFSLPNWITPSAPELLLGACAAAVMCGALAWRPAIGLTGPKESGKSTIMALVAEILSPLGIAFEGISTEAGIRQQLRHDARPVIIDEFETESGADNARVARVVKLIRSSSTATGEVARGTPDGRGFSFVNRSLFIVAAINLHKPTAADASRVVRLEMRKPDNPRETGKRIRELKIKLAGIGPRFCHRAIELAPAVLASIPRLHRELPVTQERQADNLATLLAAYAVFVRGREITDEEAAEFARDHAPAVEAQKEHSEMDDAVEALNVLLGHLVSYEGGNRNSSEAVGLVLRKLFGKISVPIRESYEAVLHQIGVRVEGDGVIVANSHPGLTTVFNGTRWQDGLWGSALARLEGAEKTKQRRFADGVRSLAVWIPSQHIIVDEDKHRELGSKAEF